ncbi:MAG: cytochrome c maturation protein CcmE [Myxococcota bacterium]|jgi:cytochrome c-type biogenesis protein CcmE|nr:cytochrome c maturation protein CcmE [Myxococcota bacterium]
MQTRNIVFVVALLGGAGLLFAIIASALGESAYLVHVDALLREPAKYADRELRVQGHVNPGSIQMTGPSSVEFELSHGGASMRVRYNGTRPESFADCADVVVGGRLVDSMDGMARFDADDMDAKSPSKYDTLPSGCGLRPESSDAAEKTMQRSQPRP